MTVQNNSDSIKELYMSARYHLKYFYSFDEWLEKVQVELPKVCSELDEKQLKAIGALVFGDK